MKKTNLLASLLPGLLSAALLLAPLPLSAAEPVTIRFGVAQVGKGGVPFSNGGVAGLADQRKALQQELEGSDVRVEWHYFKGAGPAVNEALANKQLDFAVQGDLPAVVAKAGGLDTRLITADNLLTSTYLVVPADSPARSLADLKGKRVALFKGTNLHLAILRALKQQGLGERDFRTLNMDFATMAAALTSKDIDGAWFDARAFDLQASGVGRILYDTRAVDPRLTRQGHVLVRGEFEREHPELVQKVVTALVRTAAWTSDPANRETVLSLWANSGTPLEALRAEQEGQSFQRRYSPLLDAFFVERYRTTVRESKELGLIRGDVDVARWVEPKYVQAAIEQLGLQKLWPVYDADNRPIVR
ncbi:ABC transporter substrate-binding protein [Azotobacter chroococcum]|jgi:sulfonate transport system substrate-binding protein|uniref:ABC transporter substrate-binding protein n=1 Tax=Azotobacter chroococcum TaxID=353 RepID=UPI000B5E78C8|nr:ABC transporter substrate-binding protein [Azotobacter chroococcum]ASL26302.1 nitrate ABC transporter [Azotobacter chroococcum]TKD34409.1 nitrate ABC transporter [Azotobacter chroococcum]